MGADVDEGSFYGAGTTPQLWLIIIERLLKMDMLRLCLNIE